MNVVLEEVHNKLKLLMQEHPKAHRIAWVKTQETCCFDDKEMSS